MHVSIYGNCCITSKSMVYSTIASKFDSCNSDLYATVLYCWWAAATIQYNVGNRLLHLLFFRWLVRQLKKDWIKQPEPQTSTFIFNFCTSPTQNGTVFVDFSLTIKSNFKNSQDWVRLWTVDCNVEELTWSEIWHCDLRYLCRIPYSLNPIFVIFVNTS